MPTSTWGGPESYADDTYPLFLLKDLLRQMMGRFVAHGACFALRDESEGQMRLRLHLRESRKAKPAAPEGHDEAEMRAQGRHSGAALTSDLSIAAAMSPFNSELEEVSPQQSELFAPGTTYAIGQDLIGHAWEKGEAYILSLDDYLEFFHSGPGVLPFATDMMPEMFLVVPVCEPMMSAEWQGKKSRAHVLGVIVLYQVAPVPGTGFQSRQRAEAMQYVERIALYLQNYRLQRSHRRTSEYLQILQEISTAFPTTVQLSDLVKNMYNFTRQVVDVSSVLLTLYDRDVEKLFDVFAVWNGTPIDGLTEQPVMVQKEDRPVWWQVMQVEKQTLQFSPAQDIELATRYDELLTGTWGDHRQAESFLILPMKMFTRVIGSLSITSTHPSAYQPEEIQVLETMLQIVTVSVENAKLYDRDRFLLQEARQREQQLAAINSALQSIGSVLNVTDLLHKLVQSVAHVVKVDVCVFFLLSPNKEELIAQALHGPTSVIMVDDGSGMPEISPPQNQDLIKMIRLPFQGTLLEQMVHEGFFYLDRPKLEELAQQGEEGGLIFLQETGIQQLLMIPMMDGTEFIGLLAVSTPPDHRYFRPKEIGMLLAICAQAVNAIRSAQLFEQREEAYAELERMNKLKDEFLVTASHELRTPLSAISGYSSLLKRHCQSPRSTPQQILRFVNKIAGAAQQLSDLVEKMTDAAKMSALDENLDMASEPVQILSAVEIAANMLALNIAQKITLDIDPRLWVQGDAPRLRQVLSNLLENAAKYSPPHGLIHISATAMTLTCAESLLPEDQIDHLLQLDKEAKDVVLVRVQDQGEGILEEDEKRIFEKFFRAPRSLTTPVRGSGLGLYISRRYIESMGGMLWLESTIPNEGSIFSFYLPRVEPPVDGDGQNGEEAM